MNFLTTYLKHCGISEVPRAYHRWAALSVLAAAAQDRVTVSKGKVALTPNLYIFLIGPSGVGKGEAISTMTRLVHGLPFVRPLKIKMTAASVVDLLATKQAKRTVNKVYFITPELSNSTGRGTQADDLVKMMTDLYDGRPYEPFTETTRTSGLHVISGHCVNWLAGTTREWLRDCVTSDAVEGGFFGRVMAVVGRYNLDVRVTEPVLPPDYDDLVAEMREHLAAVAELHGDVPLDASAQVVIDRWYQGRPAPEDESLIPTWKRAHDRVLKLALLAALADGPTFGIRARHVALAQRLEAECATVLPELVEFVRFRPDTDGLRRVREIIRAAGVIPPAALQRQAARYGITHDKLRVYVDTLVGSALVRRLGTNFVWRRRNDDSGSDPVE